MNPRHVERPLEISSIDCIEAFGEPLPDLSGTPLAVPFPTIFWGQKTGGAAVSGRLFVHPLKHPLGEGAFLFCNRQISLSPQNRVMIPA